MEEKISALVSMEEYSERDPSKNIKDFMGKPLLYWILKAL
jgi:CMP-N-acetylneuraminic acid synthetase